MRDLLDPHACIGAVDDPRRFDQQAAAAIEDLANELLLSAGAISGDGDHDWFGHTVALGAVSTWMDQAIGDLSRLVE